MHFEKNVSQKKNGKVAKENFSKQFFMFKMEFKAVNNFIICILLNV